MNPINEANPGKPQPGIIWLNGMNQVQIEPGQVWQHLRPEHQQLIWRMMVKLGGRLVSQQQVATVAQEVGDEVT